MDSDMKMATHSENNTVMDALRSEAIMVSSMKRIRIDAGNKDCDKDGASGVEDRRRCLQQRDEQLLKEAEVRDRLEERNSRARKLRREAARRAGAQPYCSPRPASNGYRGRLSIWAPEGFNPLLDLSHLMDECGPSHDDSAPM